MGANPRRMIQQAIRSFRRILKGNRDSRNGDISGLLSHEAFERELLKERARADRADTFFTVLALRIEDTGHATPQAVDVLVSVLEERTRITDTRGWFGAHVGVILPCTPADHVASVWYPIQNVFSKRMHSKMAGREPVPKVHYEAYSYPSNGRKRALVEESLARPENIEESVAPAGALTHT